MPHGGNMFYSIIGGLALVLHCLINVELLMPDSTGKLSYEMQTYKRYFSSVLVFYAADILWGVFAAWKIIPFSYLDTLLFFISMVWSVIMWTRVVVAFRGRDDRFSDMLRIGAWAILIFEMLALFVNLFTPVFFSFDSNGDYHTGAARFIILIAQVILYLFAALFSFIEFRKLEGINRVNHGAIGISGLIMAAFILFQAMAPLVPFYSMGCIIAATIIHTFVIQGERIYHSRELGSAKQIAYRDPMTGVKNKQAYQEMKADVDMRIDTLQLKELGIIVFDVNGLKQVNDTLGHEEGDKHIMRGCELICKQFQHSAVYRVGGDEFVAVLEGDDYHQRLSLLKEFDEMMEDHARNGGVVVAAGLDVFRAGRDSEFNSIFDRADQRMYEHKKYLKSLKTPASA